MRQIWIQELRNTEGADQNMEIIKLGYLLKVLTEGGIRHVNILQDKAQMFDQYSEEISFQG